VSRLAGTYGYSSLWADERMPHRIVELMLHAAAGSLRVSTRGVLAHARLALLARFGLDPQPTAAGSDKHLLPLSSLFRRGLSQGRRTSMQACGLDRPGKYPPAKPGALDIGSLKAAGAIAYAIRFCWPPKGGLAPHVQLFESSDLRFLLSDVFADHRFVSTYGRDEVSPGPEVHPTKLRFLSP
jgi:hypothetical protein